MQFVAAQMMSAVWNGPSTSQVMKPTVSTLSQCLIYDVSAHSPLYLVILPLLL